MLQVRKAVSGAVVVVLDFWLQGILTAGDAIAAFFAQGLIGNPANINWGKLKTTAAGITYAFPFSLPWDVGRAFDSVFGNFSNADAPEWVFSLAGESWTIRLPQMLLDWFPITRTMILVIFDITLIYSVRKLLGGAS